MTPFFSIVTPVLDRLSDIKQLIANVKGQECSDYELIIVDNGSSDGTYDYCMAHASDQIVAIQCKQRGVAFARNAGIRKAKGKWIVLLDSDNLFINTTTLTDIKHLIERHDLALGFFTQCEDDRGRRISFSNLIDKKLSFSDYLNETKGEFAPIVEASWFKNNLFPEIEGIVTEFAYCVWLNLAMSDRMVVASLKTQIYGTHAEDRICSPKVSDQRAMELAVYYFTVLDSFGERIFEASKIMYLRFLAKCFFYNNMCRRYRLADLLKFKWSVVAVPLLLVPRELTRYCVEVYKGAKSQ